MIITNKLKMDLQNPGVTPIIHAVQTDSYSRNVEIAIYSGGRPFAFPENGSVVIRYKKSDGKGGEYDTLPDGRSAWNAENNVLTIALAPQVLTTPGSTQLSVSLIEADTLLGIFSVHLAVQPMAFAETAKSENYFYITGLLNAPSSAKTGQYLRISSVNDAGKVTSVEAVDLTPGSGGYATEETDPTVPGWAKLPQKPMYTAAEVGADAAGTATATIKQHNEDENAHTDIRQILAQLSENKPETDGLPAMLYVTITGANGAYTADKTCAQILDAYTRGSGVNCIFTGEENGTMVQNLHMPLMMIENGIAFFGAYIEGMSWAILHADSVIQAVHRAMATFDDIPKALPNPCKLTFTGAATGVYDGTNSVTIEIPESSENQGEDGYTPVKGVDYWTEADKESIIQEVIAALGTPVFGTVDAQNNIIVKGDLPEGIYTLKYENAAGAQFDIGNVEIYNYLNQIPISTDANGDVFNTSGYQPGSRISISSGLVSSISNPDAENAAFVTGFIPVKNGDVVRLKNCWMDTAEYDDTGVYGHRTWALALVVYESLGGEVSGSCPWTELDTTDMIVPVVGDDGYVRQFTINRDCQYMRIVLAAADPSEALLTVNETIT